MPQVQVGDTVRIHYSSTLEDGTMVETTEGKDAIEVQAGKGTLYPKLDEEIIGMNTGEVKTVTLEPDAHVGLYRQELVTEIDRKEFTSRGIEPYQGLTLDIPVQDGKTIPATVTQFNENNVTLDANHPCAGHTLTISLQVVDVIGPSEP